jgi:hypothetical protein
MPEDQWRFPGLCGEKLIVAGCENARPGEIRRGSGTGGAVGDGRGRRHTCSGWAACHCRACAASESTTLSRATPVCRACCSNQQSQDRLDNGTHTRGENC